MATEIQPGTVVILRSPFGQEYEMTANSNVVNSTVQFFFYDHYEWVPVSDIIRIKEVAAL